MQAYSIQSSYNRTQEQTLVNIIVNLFVLQNQGDLTSSETVTLSRALIAQQLLCICK